MEKQFYIINIVKYLDIYRADKENVAYKSISGNTVIFEFKKKVLIFVVKNEKIIFE